MDRSEAYTLLTKEMKKFADLAPDRFNDLREATVEMNCLGGSGILYRVEMAVEEIGGGRFAVVGKIHDNNTYRFSLLEERLEFEFGKRA